MSAESAAESIPSGYKQTEVGVIPEDWEIATLGEVVAKFVHGGTPSTKHEDYWKGDIPWITGADILNQQVSAIRRFITTDAVKNSSTNIVNKGNLLLVSRTGVGKLAIAPCDIAISQDFTGICTKNDNLSTEYLFRFLDMNQSFLKNQNQGTSILGITRETLSSILIFFPPTLAEQESIATALSDTDALIEPLEQLIAKKRQIKQGAMQELLTGKRRLPGFSEEWEIKKLGAIAEIRSGGTPSTTQPQFWDGDILWCTPTDITALNGYKYLGETSRRITLEGLKCSSAEMIPSKSIVMTSRATIGECAINQVPVSTNQGFKNLIPSESMDVEFLYYLLLTKKQEFISLCGGSTFLEIGKTQLFMFEVELPSTKEEQTAIATILSDMDAEITALEEKLAKTRQIKQGMMQELLTGRIRLV